MNEADTCRRHVVPRLQAVGWDTAPRSIAEPRSITDGRIVPVGRGFIRRPPKRVDYLLRYTRDFPLAVIEAKAAYRSAADGMQQAKEYASEAGMLMRPILPGHEDVVVSRRPQGGATRPPSHVAATRVGRRRLLLGVGAALLGGLSAGCAVNPVSGRSEMMLLSEEEELELGRTAFAQLAWQDGGPLRIDPATQRYLEGIVRSLHQVSHRPSLPVDFTLQSASEPNAWAIPGHTAMNRGLLQYLENEAQFAFVMGHEMGHVAARHSAQRQSRATVGGGAVGLLGVAADVLGLGGVGSVAVGAAGAGTQLLLLSYDRSQELQADQLGLLYMARAGYDPREAIRAHEVLNRAIDGYLANLGERRSEPSSMSGILSTHPRHEQRVAELQAYLGTLPTTEVRIQGDGRHADRWLRETASILALAPAYARYDRARRAFLQAYQAAQQRQSAVVTQKLAESEREIAEAIRLADQAQFATLQGYILAASGRRGEARGAFTHAVALYPGYQPAVRALARLGR